MDFGNAFCKQRLERPMYVELPKPLYAQEEHNERAVKLNMSLYGLKDAAWTCSKLLYSKFERLGTKEVRSTLCVFVNSDMIVVCHVDDLHEDDIRALQYQVRLVLKIKTLKTEDNFRGLS